MTTTTRRKGDRRSVATRKKADPRRVWPTEGWATIDEVCEYLRIGRSTAYTQMAAGRIPFEQFGEIRRIPWAALRKAEAAAARNTTPK